MAEIRASELENLKIQLIALERAKGGRARLFDVLYRLVANDQQPYQSFFDPNMYGVGYGGLQPEEVRTIANQRKTILLSEDPADKSLWYRVNYELADIILNTESLVSGTTGDERRIVRSYANTLSAEEKQKLIDAIQKIEPADSAEKYDLPGISES